MRSPLYSCVYKQYQTGLYKVTKGRPKPLWCNCFPFQAVWTFRNKGNLLIKILIITIIAIVQNLDMNPSPRCPAFSSKSGWKH